MKPRLLDLFCGAGGAAMGYHRAGFEVVGVDIVPQPNYPFKFHQADGLLILRDLLAGRWPWEFGAIHASPPCQAYSNLRQKDDNPALVDPVRNLLLATGLPYVIENVVGAPLREPTMLCGSAFALGVRRHRLFETNFPAMSPGCSHGSQRPRFDVYQRGKWYLSPVAHVWGSGGGKAREHWGEAMNIGWMTDREIVEAIPPAYTEHIGHYLMVEVERNRRMAA